MDPIPVESGKGDPNSKLDILAIELARLGEKGWRSAAQMEALVEDLRGGYAELVRQREELSSLYQVAQGLAATTELSDLLESIIDKAIVLTGAERGFVALCDSGRTCRICAARRFSAGEVEATDEAFSSSLIERVVRSREPVLTTNIQEDGRFELTQSIILQRIRSVLAVPLIARGELQGAIYVDTRASERHFGNGELGVLKTMASQAAMAIRNARLYEDLRISNEHLQAALSELRETQGQLLQTERLAALGRLAASVAHELRNPLMVMRNSLYFLDRLVADGKLDADILKRYLGKLDSEIDRQSKIINDLLYFSRNRPRQLTQVDLNGLLSETVIRLSRAESVIVRTELAPDLGSISADGDQLQQVFVNLLSNAIQAMPDGGTLVLSTAREGDWVVVQVSDTGVGISEENRKRLFEPFFTTKERGIGLGLSVTKSIVEGHRGTISVVSQVGQGTTFTVRLPVELIG